MSLDVYLRDESGEVYWANITHNLTRMAAEAGIYEALWRPGEMKAPEVATVLHDAIEEGHWEVVRSLEQQLPAVHARDLIEPLRIGLELLKSDRPRFEKFNAPNGWGLYEHFVPFVEKYLAACEENPDAAVEVSR